MWLLSVCVKVCGCISPFKFPLACRIVCSGKVLCFPSSAACFLFSLGGLCAVIVFPFRVSSRLIYLTVWMPSLCLYCISTIQFWHLFHMGITRFTSDSSISFLSTRFICAHATSFQTEDTKPQFCFSGAWIDVKMIYKALSSQCHGQMIPSVQQLQSCLPELAY